MEHHPKYQWAVFNPDRSQQCVVRADTFAEFPEAVNQLKGLLPLVLSSGTDFHVLPLPFCYTGEVPFHKRS